MKLIAHQSFLSGYFLHRYDILCHFYRPQEFAHSASYCDVEDISVFVSQMQSEVFMFLPPACQIRTIPSTMCTLAGQCSHYFQFCL